MSNIIYSGPLDARAAGLYGGKGGEAVYFEATVLNPTYNPEDCYEIRGVRKCWGEPTLQIANLVIYLSGDDYRVAQAWTDESYRRQGIVRRLYEMAWDYARSRGKGFRAGWVQSPLMAKYWESMVDQGKAEAFDDEYTRFNTTGKGWRRIRASNLRPPCDPFEHGYAFIEPSGVVHRLSMSHPKWAENYLLDHPELGTNWYERIGGLLKHGWIRVANITNLSVLELNTPPKAAWAAVLDLMVDCVRKGMDPNVIIHVDHGAGDSERTSKWRAGDFARKFGGRAYEDALFDAAMSRVATKKASVGKHKLPKLPYAYDALEPHISEETLRFHHDKHHKAYVDGLNDAEKKIQAARKAGDFESIPVINAAQAFNAGGHVLHVAYWESLTPDYKEPSKALVDAIERDFGSWDAFRSQMKESTVKVRGSGWGVLVLTPAGLRIVTVMNHENGVLWDGSMLLPIDAWEHAYYLDYQNDRAAHFDAVFDHLVNWSEVERRLQESYMKKEQTPASNKTGGGILTAATVTVDKAHVDALRKDVLMIARAADNVASLEDIDQVTQATHSWRKQWETLAYTLRQDLEARVRAANDPYDTKYNASPPVKEDAEYYLESALSPMWDFNSELGRNPRTDTALKDAYGNPWQPPEKAFEATVQFFLDRGYSATREDAVREAQRYHDRRPLSTKAEAEAIAVSKWKAEAVKWTRRLRDKARKAWDTLNRYVDWLESWRGGKRPLEVIHPEEEVVPLAGFRVIFRGFAESAYKDELESVRVGLERYRKALTARAPLLLKMTPPIFIEWTFEPTSSGDAAAYYTHNRVNITPWVVGKDIDRFVKTMAHEVGHHLFRVYLANDAKDAWAQFIRDDYRDLDLREALAVMDKVGAKSIIDESLMREDPILHIQLSTLMNDPGYSRVADWLFASGIRKYLDAGENPIIRVPKNPITGYAGKNPDEAFCEALGNLVAYGPKAVPDAVLKMLRSVLGGGVRVASRVAAAWLGRTAARRKRPSTGDCYEAAGRYILNSNDPSLRLVHAEVAGQGALTGKTFGHAWVLDGDTVIDQSNGRDLRIPKAVYYALGSIDRIDNIHEYTQQQAFAKMGRHEHFGPWDLKTRSGL